MGDSLRSRLYGAACVLLLAGLAGCSDQDAGASGPIQTGTPWFDEVQPAASAGSATACALPVTVPLAAKWLAKPVRADAGPADSLVRQGESTLACEIDAKPAGQIGFIRVWVAKRGATDPRPVLEAFLAADTGLKELTYRNVKAGGMKAAEVTFLRDSPMETGGKRERALAVAAPTGVMVMTVSGLNTEQYNAMLPAYGLARRDMKPAG
jgi:hypothetical protein